MNLPLLQAHRGVSSDYPENTMSAFIGAKKQGYPIIELDPAVTADEKIVILHDNTLNRTARKRDGSELDTVLEIGQVTYAEALNYDFGSYVSNKFKNEKLPLLSDVLEFAYQNDILIKIDHKFRQFSRHMQKKLFDIVNSCKAKTAFTVPTVDEAKLVMENVSDCEIHYDGAVTEETLTLLSSVVPMDRLVVWLPYANDRTRWVKIPFATKELCALVKKYARLGIWLINDYDQYHEAALWGADIVETNGQIKPAVRLGVIADTHIHSEYSHDSVCPVAESRDAALKKGIHILNITDHCDIEYYDTIDNQSLVSGSIASAKAANNHSGVTVLSGMEISEQHWYMDETDKILFNNHPDVIIGSVHAVEFPDYRVSYSGIDFVKMGKETTVKYLDCYFDDMLKMIYLTDFDVLAHITCPLRYINKIQKLGIDIHMYEAKIKKILEEIIKRKIALEINTSSYDADYREFLPDRWIVELYKEMGGHLITLASDAHISQNIGKDFDIAIDMVKEIGFRYICYFEERYLHQCTI